MENFCRRQTPTFLLDAIQKPARLRMDVRPLLARQLRHARPHVPHPSPKNARYLATKPTPAPRSRKVDTDVKQAVAGAKQGASRARQAAAALKSGSSTSKKPATTSHKPKDEETVFPSRATAPIPPRAASQTVAAQAAETPSPTPESTPLLAAGIPARPKRWLTRKVEESPAFRAVFMAVAGALGYETPKQLAARRAFVLYKDVCAVMPDEQREFWKNACYMPPTFQSWFTITNLHVWMLTVRLRALPSPDGTQYLQSLVDHFFIDIEDRVRTVLQPPPTPTKPYTFASPFYVNPNAPDHETDKSKPLVRAPDRLVTTQMKIFKEQWAGMGMSLDLGLVKGDEELAASVWRNILGGRGANGIAYPDPDAGVEKAAFRRAVNLVGGEQVNVAKIDLAKEETQDDGSGVHDFPPAECDKYVAYPELMLDVVGYIRQELVRLESISDGELMSGNWEQVRFGKVKKVLPVKE